MSISFFLWGFLACKCWQGNHLHQVVDTWGDTGQTRASQMYHGLPPLGLHVHSGGWCDKGVTSSVISVNHGCKCSLYRTFMPYCSRLWRRDSPLTLECTWDWQRVFQEKQPLWLCYSWECYWWKYAIYIEGPGYYQRQPWPHPSSALASVWHNVSVSSGCNHDLTVWYGLDGEPLLKSLSARWLLVKEYNKQRFLTPGHQGWNDLHSLCRIGSKYYLLNNDDNNIIYWIMMIIMIMMMIMIIMMTMMMIGTATIMIMIIIITTTLTMTIMKMIMIKTAQTPCQSLYKDRRI